MPYLEVQKQETEEDITQSIEMPNFTGMNLQEAKGLLKEIGLEFELEGIQSDDENNEQIIIDQLPKTGIQVKSGTKVTLYIQ